MRWERKFKEQLSGFKIISFLCVLAFTLVFAGCKRQETYDNLSKEATTASANNLQSEPEQATKEQTFPSSEDKDDSREGTEQMTEPAEENTEMKMFINGNRVSVSWEDNESVEALKEIAADGIGITMSMYGGFEQVGQIGQDIPANDEEMTTEPGDIVLYSGNQLVVFYGSNSWAYTKLGHITDKTEEELEQLLGEEDVTIRISMEDSE